MIPHLVLLLEYSDVHFSLKIMVVQTNEFQEFTQRLGTGCSVLVDYIYIQAKNWLNMGPLTHSYSFSGHAQQSRSGRSKTTPTVISMYYIITL